jgi:biofilm PGA synthesis N-glycosyltransferase PgaC
VTISPAREGAAQAWTTVAPLFPDADASATTAAHPQARTGRLTLTCIIPAYNEAASIQDTVRSVRRQSDPPDVVIVVDDGSSDDTGALAEAAGAVVIQPPTNTGSKAGAQSFALDFVTTPLTMVLDADSTLTYESVAILRRELERDHELAAACSYVVPRHRRTMWERGRYVEYLYAFGHGKQVQDLYGRALISSGCFSMYRTEWLRRTGGWSSRTLAEDMDLTWTLYRMGAKVRFLPDAVCEPIEPDTGAMMRTQLRRWSHGFLQNVRVHRRGIIRQPTLRAILSVALWDGVLSAFFYVVILPILVVVFGPIALLGYVIDLPAIAFPVLYEGAMRGEFLQALASLPSFFVLRLVNSVMMLRAIFEEVVLRRSFDVYEKGH